MLQGTYNLKYDAKGNITEELLDDGQSQVKTTRKFNDNNKVVDYIEETLDPESGEGFVNSLRKTTEYDPRIPDLVVDFKTYSWTNGAWDYTTGGNCNKRDITRNEAGNVTSVVISTIYQGEFKEVQRQILTYDDRGLASTYRMEKFDPSFSTWSTQWWLKNIEWESTDGQLGKEYDEWFSGNNKIKKADFVDVDDNGKEFTFATLKVKYDSKGGYTSIIDGTVLASLGYTASYQESTLTYTDDYGSYTYEEKYYEEKDGDGKYTDADLKEHDKIIQTFNEHGHSTYYAELFGEYGELVYGGATKTEYTYDDVHNAITQETMYESDGEEDENGELIFTPSLRFEFEQFHNVSTAINTTIQQPEDGIVKIYNMQGEYVGNLFDRIPKGLYIVKNKDGKTTKVVKR